MTFRSCCPFISRKKIISDVYCATDEDDIKGIYDGDEASEAYYSGKIKSLALDEASSVRVTFINWTATKLIFCWVDCDGVPHHFRTLDPSPVTIINALDGHTMQSTEENVITEKTLPGHFFVLARKKIMTDGKNCLDPADVIAGYQVPFMEGNLSTTIVTVTRRKRRVLQKGSHRFPLSLSDWEYIASVRAGSIDSTPLDTSKKVYYEATFGRWPVKCEDGLFKEGDKLQNVKKQIEEDLVAASAKLPTTSYTCLQSSTPIWINRNQKYGPRCAPVTGTGACFHPEKEWIESNGMCGEKCGGVELYEVEKYADDRNLWHGTGGVMLHEFSHAWHYKFVEDGYENREILECYHQAMEEKLYDNVSVHCFDDEGESNGKTKKQKIKKQRAYACTNAMEYFAELSTAFLGGVGDDQDIEFNRWFPFNRKQVKEHDPRAYKLLKKIWNIKGESD